MLGWFAPAMIKPKILLQRLWEEGLDWDVHVPVSKTIQDSWARWRDGISEQRKHDSMKQFPDGIKYHQCANTWVL